MQHGGATWNRPTWKMGLGTKSFVGATAAFGATEDPYGFFEELHHKPAEAKPETSNLPPDVRDACAELGVTPPLNSAKVRKVYHKLAKEHHPDRNKDPESADKIKRINDAYRVLKQYLKDEAAQA